MFNKTKAGIKWFWLELLKRIDSIFREGSNPGWSSGRVISVSLVFIPITVWAIICLSTWTIVALPESIVAIILLAVTGKVAGKYVEMHGDKTIGK